MAATFMNFGSNEGKQAELPIPVRPRSVRLIGGDFPGSKEPVLRRR